MKKRNLAILSAAVLSLIALSGCSGNTGASSTDKSPTEATSAPAAQTTAAKETTTAAETTAAKKEGPTYGGSVVVGIQQDVDSLDPHKVVAAGTKEILFNIFEGLVKADPNGNLMPALASDYTISEDGLVYTFTLRQDVKFHDGTVMKAEDVKYSLERAAGLLDGTPLVAALKVITGVDIVDDKTVQVTIANADTELIYSFTTAIIPEGSGEAENAAPVGTGPFSFASYTAQDSLVVKKNEDYWQKGLPYLDEVTFKIVTGDAAMLALKGGSMDIYARMTDSQAEEMKSSMQILSAPSNVVQALFLNNEREPLNKKEVRQAICYALDKDMTNEFISGGRANLIGSAMLPTLTDYYVDTNDVYGSAADPEKAKALLAEAGYPDGIDLEITVPNNYEIYVQSGDVAAECLKAAGIRVTINPVEWSTWLSDVYNGRQYQSTICGITCDMTPGYLMNRFQTGHKKNFINYSNPEYDEVFKIAAGTDEQKKREAYKQLQKILTEDAGSAFIQVNPLLVAVNPKLDGYTFYPVYVQDMSTMYFK